MALLGRPAITSLRPVTCGDSLNIQTLKESYPKLCNGIGLIQQPYTIKLRPKAESFSLKTLCHIPLPLMPKVKNELQSMEQIGLISKVEEPTEWCS